MNVTITPKPSDEALIDAAIQAGLIDSAADALDVGLRQLRERLAPAPLAMQRTMSGDIPVFAIGKPMPVEMIQETLDRVRSERRWQS